MKVVITLGARSAGICRNAGNRYLTHRLSWHKSIGRIARQWIKDGERLDLLGDVAIETNPGDIEHLWREYVPFLDAGGLTLRKRSQKKATELVGSACLATIE